MRTSPLLRCVSLLLIPVLAHGDDCAGNSVKILPGRPEACRVEVDSPGEQHAPLKPGIPTVHQGCQGKGPLFRVIGKTAEDVLATGCLQVEDPGHFHLTVFPHPWGEGFLTVDAAAEAKSARLPSLFLYDRLGDLAGTVDPNLLLTAEEKQAGSRSESHAHPFRNLQFSQDGVLFHLDLNPWKERTPSRHLALFTGTGEVWDASAPRHVLLYLQACLAPTPEIRSPRLRGLFETWRFTDAQKRNAVKAELLECARKMEGPEVLDFYAGLALCRTLDPASLEEILEKAGLPKLLRYPENRHALRVLTHSENEEMRKTALELLARFK